MASFRVNKLAKTIIAAALPRQECRLPQSNIDILYPPNFNIGVCFCYQKPPETGHSFGSVVNTLKSALSKTLVSYYPVAGEMVTNAAGDPELLCNNRGVDFEEAYADVELRDLNLYKPDESLHDKLLPVLKHGVLAAQATQLRCGGVVVGCTFDHRIADGSSASMLWKSWAEMARSMPLSTLPSFRRSLLSPRRPLRYGSSVTDLYIPVSKIQPYEIDISPLVSRIYSVSEDQIQGLQLLANHENPSSLISKRTKLEAFSAFLWKLIASGTNTGDNSSRLGIAIDGRTRISGESMHNYFGNVISNSFGRKKCGELEEMPLSSIANEIHSFLSKAASNEHFLGLIDFVEACRPEAIMPTMFAENLNVDGEELPLNVASGRGFPVGEMDFGWGVPVFGSYVCPVDLPFGNVITLPGAGKDGGWVVYVILPERHIKVIENAGSHILKPFCLH